MEFDEKKIVIYNNLKGRFQCKYCFKYLDKRGLNVHQPICEYRNGDWKIEVKDKEYHCRFCNEQYGSKESLGGHSTMCMGNPNRNETIEKIALKRRGKKHTQVTKDKISASMKAFWKLVRSYNGSFVNKVKIIDKITPENNTQIIFDDDF
ncbi:MAG: hypothetical protein HRT89_06400 [Lentisphaeria bacterium]|nr:hypothetical protein [Lentisphaeria bacterium]NQZ67683.1 hypothetical protein [Lentisphaeria bacterium]